jgi:bacterioferritin
MTVKPFLSDIKTIRQRARQYLRDGAITASYMPDRDTFSSSSIKH